MPTGDARTDLLPRPRQPPQNPWHAVPPDLGAILATQWGPRHFRRRTGSARLGAAILREAWFALRAPQTSAVYRAAHDFFFAPPHPTAPVSLELACLLAEIDPDHVRRAVGARLDARRGSR